jgi:hypothetical protein
MLSSQVMDDVTLGPAITNQPSITGGIASWSLVLMAILAKSQIQIDHSNMPLTIPSIKLNDGTSIPIIGFGTGPSLPPCLCATFPHFGPGLMDRNSKLWAGLYSARPIGFKDWI